MNFVYVVYDRYDNGPECVSIHNTAETAVTGLNDAGHGKIGKVWFGKPFSDEIRRWEEQSSADPTIQPLDREVNTP